MACRRDVCPHCHQLVHICEEMCPVCLSVLEPESGAYQERRRQSAGEEKESTYDA